LSSTTESLYTNVPVDDLNEITISFNMDNVPHKSDYHFTQQSNFDSVSEVKYIGLQTREGSKGMNIIHTSFSFFQGRITTKHPKCHVGEVVLVSAALLISRDPTSTLTA
jgi:hypothetical protein